MSEVKELPKGWEMVKVASVANLYRGITYTKDVASNASTEHNLPILRGNNIDGELNFEDLVYVPKGLIKAEQIVKEGDIIFAMSSGSKHLVGKSAVAKKDFAGSYGAFCALLRINNNADKKYIAYIFKGNTYRKLISEIAKGTNINNLKREHILDFEFPLPPPSTQAAIVSKIDELFSELDKGIESLKTAQQQLRTYRQSVLKWAFEGRLTRDDVKDGELPEGWKIDILSLNAKVLSGYAFKSSDFISKGVPVIKISNVGYSDFEWKDQQYLPEEFLSANSDFIIIPGDLLIALTRPITNNTTKVCRYPKNSPNALLNQRVACIKKCTLNQNYLFLYMQTTNFKEYIRSKFSETLQPNLSPKDLAMTPIPIPSSKEQQQIVEEIERRLTVADKMEESISQSLLQAEALRQSILKMAFEGRLVKEENEMYFCILG